MGESDGEMGEGFPLDTAEPRRYRAITARLNYLNADRVDIQHAVGEAASGMSSPMGSGWSILSMQVLQRQTEAGQAVSLAGPAGPGHELYRF